MANSYTFLPMYFENVADFTAMRNLLVAKYGEGITIHYQNSDNLIFSCPTISDKVIRMHKLGIPYLNFSYGDAWTTGATITNPVVFVDFNALSQVGYHIVFGDTFLFMHIMLPMSSTSITVLIGKDTSGKTICGGFTGSNSGVTSFKLRNATDNSMLDIITFSSSFTGLNNTIYKEPIKFKKNDGSLYATAEGVPITISGINISSLGLSSSVVLSNKLITQKNVYAETSTPKMATGFILEW